MREIPRPIDVPECGLVCDVLWSDPDELREIPRPIDVPECGLVCDVLWSDPDERVHIYACMPNSELPPGLPRQFRHFHQQPPSQPPIYVTILISVALMIFAQIVEEDAHEIQRLEGFPKGFGSRRSLPEMIIFVLDPVYRNAVNRVPYPLPGWRVGVAAWYTRARMLRSARSGNQKEVLIAESKTVIGSKILKRQPSDQW
ncbi:unnamed protein product [Notodromas monacha]|uniref:Protein-serine/threonine phosphatase n=1 Tax=Notodromas monacha TaxID=399045 RepID=A0A7R9GHX1_9CRUS|nr:unnamed protein product [Notodromas monacha]CAG0921795.1 unnamed protein product [Notodromas monacha]